jgi:sialic acid synthase
MSPSGGKRTFRIARTVIHDDSNCYVVAEVGHNHQGSLETAFKLMDEAQRCGADAVKLQKRDNRSLYTAGFFNKPYDHDNSFGLTYGEHREALEFGGSEYKELRAYADELDVDFFATAFDKPSADFLAALDMPAYKIASADIRNLPLLRYVAQIGKPMILSSGGATMDDVRRAYEAVAEFNSQIAILQCTACYPASFHELDLRVIQSYRDEFPESVVGLSGHDNGIAMTVAAYVLGARIIEKHFTLNRAMKGTDHRFSLEPEGLRKMVRDLRRVKAAMGDGEKRVYDSEVGPIMKMSKKLVAARELPAGHMLTEDDVAAKSPGDGLPPSEMGQLIGRRLRIPVEHDTTLSYELLEETELERQAAKHSPLVQSA